MLSALSIIKKKVDPEGFPIDKSVLMREAVKRVARGQDLVFQFGTVVFTLSRDRQEVHLYADNAGCTLLSATAQFMRDVWPFARGDYLVAPILNPRVEKLAKRFGWLSMGKLASGHSLYMIRRPRT